MCKVRIVNCSSNYSYGSKDNPTIETDIPSEVVPVFKKVFDELNSKRIHACVPKLYIKEI